MRRVLLLCSGQGKRWGNYLGVPKHLIEIDGERLIDRAVRLVRERGGGEIFIVAPRAEYETSGATRVDPVSLSGLPVDTDKFLSSAHLWAKDDRTVILYGDVFFTERAMDLILSDRGDYTFFGRPRPSRTTGCGWQEIFAFAFEPRMQERIATALRGIRSALISGAIPRGGGWELYRYLRNIEPLCDLEISTKTDGAFVQIDDFTEDFDYPSDFDKWLWRYEMYKYFLAGAPVRATTFGVSPGLCLE